MWQWIWWSCWFDETIRDYFKVYSFLLQKKLLSSMQICWVFSVGSFTYHTIQKFLQWTHSWSCVIFFFRIRNQTNGKRNCRLKKTISAGKAIVIKVNSTVTSGTEISSLLYDTKQLLQIGRVKDCWLKQTRKSITKVNKFISLKYS